MNISFFPEPNIILQIGGISLYLYGALYVLGALACIWWVWKKSHLSFDTVSDMGAVTLLGGVIGGRLGYVLIYNFSYYFEHPLQILAVWQGGMSIHGGLLGGALAFLWFCKKNDINWKTTADILVPALAFALMLGRFGNFMNAELLGRPSSVPWAMDFGDGVLRHPSQLYAMGKDFLLSVVFAFILLKYQNRPFWKPGQLFFLFLGGYAILRFIVEFFRAPDVQIGFVWHLTMGQWLSFIVLVIAIIGYRALGGVKR